MLCLPQQCHVNKNIIIKLTSVESNEKKYLMMFLSLSFKTMLNWVLSINCKRHFLKNTDFFNRKNSLCVLCLLLWKEHSWKLP